MDVLSAATNCEPTSEHDFESDSSSEDDPTYIPDSSDSD